uniref:U1 small nuclear ribonucleoprotein 70 kDa n=1 Tax=Parastrongyloides trichosuri TaxID=131310 RepID=A0A0N4Z323_PARTI
MTQFLPDNLIGLFFARPPIQYLPPVSPLLVEKDPIKYTGVAQYLSLFEDPKDTPSKVVVQSKEQKKAEKAKQREELLAFKLEQDIAAYQSRDTSSYTTDPFKTLFVCRLSYETTESKLKREFSRWGTIVNVKIIVTKEEKPRGYAFIEYSRKSEMSQAYKEADGMKIDGMRILVDYERGRTRKDWLPRRLGGGKGKTRAIVEKKQDENRDDKYSSKGSSYAGRDDRYNSRSGRKDRDSGYNRPNDDRRNRGGDRRDYDDRRKRYDKNDRNSEFRRLNNRFDDRGPSNRNYKSGKDDTNFKKDELNFKRPNGDNDKNGPPAKRYAF